MVVTYRTGPSFGVLYRLLDQMVLLLTGCASRPVVNIEWSMYIIMLMKIKTKVHLYDDCMFWWLYDCMFVNSFKTLVAADLPFFFVILNIVRMLRITLSIGKGPVIRLLPLTSPMSPIGTTYSSCVLMTILAIVDWFQPSLQAVYVLVRVYLRLFPLDLVQRIFSEYTNYLDFPITYF